MAAEGDGGSESFRVEGTVLRVDVRPALLVAQLPGPAGEPFVTTHSADGLAQHRPVVAGVRQSSYRVRDNLTVEATRSSAFVAVADDDGRCVVVSVAGEVVVHPGASGEERVALAPHETLVTPAPGEPGGVRVQPTAELSEEDQAEVGRVLDRVGAVIASVAAPTPAQEAAAAGHDTSSEVPKEAPAAAAAGHDTSSEVPKEAAAAGHDTSSEVPKEAPAEGPAGPGTPAKPPVPTAGGAAKSNAPRAPKGKKGKKGRTGTGAPRPAGGGTPTAKAGGPTKKGPPQSPSAVGGPTSKAAPAAKKGTPQKGASQKVPPDETRGAAVGAAGAKKATGAAKAKVSTTKSADDAPPRSRVFVVAGLIAAAVGAILLAYALSDTDSDVAINPPQTATTTPATTESPATTEAPATTEMPATTTTEVTTTTSAPPAPNYRVDPKSCVQRGNTITYSAAITNLSDRAFDYVVRVAFVDRDGRPVTSANARVDDLGPGRQADFSATGSSTEDLAAIGARCDVEGIDATPS